VFRRDLIDLLLNHPMTAHQIAREKREKPRDIESDLEHLQKSLRHGDYNLIVTPATCRKCGFEFSPEKINKPSKCPKCRETWIADPVFEIRPRQS